VAELIARTPCAGLLPLSIGTVAVTEEDPGRMTVIAPFNGQEAALSKALVAAHGMEFPAPNRSTGKAGARAVWFGQGQALLIGPDPDPGLGRLAALVDQSDGWAVVRIDGEGAVAVLARLVPVDLRAEVFRRGHTLRSQIGHMPGSVTRVSADGFRVMVFRSMARTLVHDVKTAMEAVAARG
jgi:sarcosine oxidase subunit gamma